MKSNELDSCCFRHVAYNSRQRVLELEFRRGGTYSYFGVPSESVGRLLHAPSMGRFYARRIRNQYPCARGRWAEVASRSEA